MYFGYTEMLKGSTVNEFRKRNKCSNAIIRRVEKTLDLLLCVLANKEI